MSKTLTLSQGASDNACYDTLIMNDHTSSCVLVIVFFADRQEVFAYHWPGFNMSDDGREIIEFQRLYGFKSNPISKLVILSNCFPKDEDSAERVKSVLRLKRECGNVETHYYVNPVDRDCIFITIDVAGNCVASTLMTHTIYQP